MSTVLTPEAQTRVASPAPLRVANPVVRWFAALILIVYGFAKLNGSQFTVLDSELDKPMGTVSGFWLTWYSRLLAGVREPGRRPPDRRRASSYLAPVRPCRCAPPPARRRQHRPGGCVLRVDLGGTVAAVVLLALLLWVVAACRATAPGGHRRGPACAVALARLGGRIASCFRGCLHLLDRELQQSCADGDRRGVGRGGGRGGRDRRSSSSAIGRSRRHQGHLGNYLWRHFEVDPDGRIQIWSRWMRKGDLLFEDDTRRTPRWCTMAGGEGGEDALILRRAPH